MAKIVILGPSGSGKSTLAKILEKELDIPCYHLDSLYFLENWVAKTQEQFEQDIHKILNKSEWILEGNYHNHLLKERLLQSTHIIILDYPRYKYMFRLLKRYIKYYKKSRPDVPEGCIENLDWEFLTFAWKYPKRRKLLFNSLTITDVTKVHIVKTNKELKSLITTMKKQKTKNKE